MNETMTMPHQGRNVKRIREILGIKQDVLAMDLGITQQAISFLEQKETLDAPTLEKVAGILKVPVEVLQHFDEDKMVSIISNTFNDQVHAVGHVGSYNPIFNSLEKYTELVEANKNLYEQLLQSEREKNQLLQQVIDQLKK